MKQFKTLTERQILDAAYITYLDIWVDAKKAYAELPNEAKKTRLELANARVDELRKAISELAERPQPSGKSAKLHIQRNGFNIQRVLLNSMDISSSAISVEVDHNPNHIMTATLRLRVEDLEVEELDEEGNTENPSC